MRILPDIPYRSANTSRWVIPSHIEFSTSKGPTRQIRMTLRKEQDSGLKGLEGQSPENCITDNLSKSTTMFLHRFMSSRALIFEIQLLLDSLYAVLVSLHLFQSVHDFHDFLDG